MKGIGTDVNEELGIEWLIKSADSGHPKAQFSLYQMSGELDSLPFDANKSVEWLRRAAESGYTEAETHYGLFLLEAANEKSSLYDEAEKWLIKASKKGDQLAKDTLLSVLY